MNYLINGTFVEAPSPQAKPCLVRLAPFQIGVRPGPQCWAVRDEILAVLSELVNECGEFKLRDLMTRLNPDRDPRRRWAVEKVIFRMVTVGRGSTEMERRRVGLYRYRSDDSVGHS